jgi:hypothetical protein
VKRDLVVQLEFDANLLSSDFAAAQCHANFGHQISAIPLHIVDLLASAEAGPPISEQVDPSSVVA